MILMPTPLTFEYHLSTRSFLRPCLGSLPTSLPPPPASICTNPPPPTWSSPEYKMLFHTSEPEQAVSCASQASFFSYCLPNSHSIQSQFKSHFCKVSLGPSDKGSVLLPLHPNAIQLIYLSWNYVLSLVYGFC